MNFFIFHIKYFWHNNYSFSKVYIQEEMRVYAKSIQEAISKIHLFLVRYEVLDVIYLRTDD